MNNKQLKLMLAAFLVFSCLALALAGCAGNSDQKSDTQADTGTQTAAPAEDTSETAAPADDAPQANTRTLTIPRSRFEDDRTDDEIRTYLEERGYENIAKDGDGNWTVTMSTEVYDAYIAALDEGLEETVNSLKNSSDWPNIANVEHNEDYSEIVITLKSDKMTLTDSFAPMTVGIPVCTLQEAGGGVAGCHIVILGSDGSQLKEANYPEAVENTISTFMDW